MNATSPFSLRLRNQFFTELRLLRWPALGFIIALAFRLQMRLHNDPGSILYRGQSSLLGMIALIAIWIIATSIRMDAPSNSNTATLTRPVGGNVTWLAKLLTLFFMIAVPWLACDVIDNFGYGYRFIAWTGIGSASLLCSLLIIVVTAAMMSLAASHRQAMIIIFCGAAGIMAWFWIFDSVHNTIKKNDRLLIPDNLKICGEVISAGLLLIAALSSWWWATVPRRRFIAAAFFIFGILQWPLTQKLWSYDWLTKPEQIYNAKNLTINVGSNVPANTQKLWPRLSLGGLAPDEVATVIAFAPSNPGRSFTPGTFATDYAPESGKPAISSNFSHFQPDHIRSLSKQYPDTDLWHFRAAQQREPLKFVLESSAPPRLETSWRLRLAIQRMQKVADIPLSEIWDQSKGINIGEGQRIEIGPAVKMSQNSQLTCWIRRNGSSLISPNNNAPIKNMQGMEIARSFILVFQDVSSRELKPEFATQIWVPYAIKNMSLGWIRSLSIQISNLNLPQPWAKMAILGTTQEDWIKSTTVQVWAAEERGIVDREISAEDMKQILP